MDFRGQGFRVLGLSIQASGFPDVGFGFRVHAVGFRVLALGFRIYVSFVPRSRSQHPDSGRDKWLKGARHVWVSGPFGACLNPKPKTCSKHADNDWGPGGPDGSHPSLPYSNDSHLVLQGHFRPLHGRTAAHQIEAPPLAMQPVSKFGWGYNKPFCSPRA